MTLLEHVDALRRLALIDPRTTSLQLAMINVLEEIATRLDRLDGGDEHGFGSI